MVCIGDLRAGGVSRFRLRNLDYRGCRPRDAGPQDQGPQEAGRPRYLEHGGKRLDFTGSQGGGDNAHRFGRNSKGGCVLA